MPILKQLVAGSQTKRRSRMDLTTEMISAPLGDFRHTMHVGRSGEAFGDTSFLSTRSGEPSQEGHTYPRSPKPGLLSRTFRSSKRSQSVTRVDQQDNTLLPPSGSPTFVKNAMSLPFLNNEDEHDIDSRELKSLTSSPSNGASANALDLELHEKHFGVLTDLRPYPSYNGGGMKKAESVMSFHVDLGPSMLGEILGVMEKEDDDQGFEEGKSSEGHASPLPCNQGEVDMDEEMREVAVKEEEPEGLVAHDEGPMRAPSSVDLEIQSEGTSTPEPHHKHLHHLDSCSNSSSGSAAMEEKTTSEPYEEDIGITDNTCNPDNEPAFSSFMEDEDDEIRV
ncbi:cdc42 effector protein 4a [Rhinichthys klamathensis goyatoka]|uniref:cdc42 effector protein 4a n=1 Tax=Rhinichthys klamathensis goyatoka TaxID=3034132 RepID=UPI0024B5FD54|nr:cdc42 effector protein 4a [Rhinichthys klamathensis goyatoka]XP_056128454.1 cdc42 effector protein 4a [Rhinichthys klamathensis goyatoka]XP_056128459.1 cdc42 effector protein 4a [Rhinichthys klamathensis goyatoka]XP_056128466.1 cdc42 effector protein 4a [Rhinichthys klamathensis goyatoka]